LRKKEKEVQHQQTRQPRKRTSTDTEITAVCFPQTNTLYIFLPRTIQRNHWQEGTKQGTLSGQVKGLTPQLKNT
jgi:hypothetical protein